MMVHGSMCLSDCGRYGAEIFDLWRRKRFLHSNTSLWSLTSSDFHTLAVTRAGIYRFTHFMYLLYVLFEAIGALHSQ